MAGIVVRGLDAVREKLGRLARMARVPTIVIELPAEDAAKLEYLRDGGRDMTAMSAVMLAEMVYAASKGVVAVIRGADSSEPWRRGAQAWLDRVTARVASGGADIRNQLRPLAESTIERKGHARVGYDSGDLFRALQRATVRVQY